MRIRDHAGQRVPLLSISSLRGDEARVERRARLERATAGQPMLPTKAEVRRAIPLALLALPLFIAAAVAPAVLTSVVPAPWWAVIGLSALLGLVPPVVTIAVVRRVASARIVDGCVRAGYCASCGYDIAATPADESGLRRCPECGAAWRGEKDESAPQPD